MNAISTYVNQLNRSQKITDSVWKPKLYWLDEPLTQI